MSAATWLRVKREPISAATGAELAAGDAVLVVLNAALDYADGIVRPDGLVMVVMRDGQLMPCVSVQVGEGTAALCPVRANGETVH